MNNLHMSAEKEKKMDEIENLSLDTIKETLRGVTDAEDEVVKVAVKMMGVVAKNRQTLTHRSALDFTMASTVATENELKKYVKNTSPQVQKALGKN